MTETSDPAQGLRRVKLHADFDLDAAAPYESILVAPLRGGPPGDDSRWSAYERIAPSLFELSTLEDCDFAVLPFPWDFAVADAKLRRAAAHAGRRAHEAGKELLVFSDVDDNTMIPMPNALSFKTSLHRSERTAREFAQPAWADDLLQRFRGGSLEMRAKQARPVVGFCGYAPPHGLRVGRGLAKERARGALRRVGLADRLGFSTAMHLRARCITILAEDDSLDTNFVFRDGSYRDVDGNVGSWHSSVSYRADYVANILASDYVLCTRGWGNFSFRLFEALSLGRIPIFVDSDCVLPAEDLIDWRSLCVWISEQEVADMPDVVQRHYASMDDDQYAERQRHCRDVWTSQLSPAGFFRYLHGWLLRRSGSAAASAS